MLIKQKVLQYRKCSSECLPTSSTEDTVETAPMKTLYMPIKID